MSSSGDESERADAGSGPDRPTQLQQWIDDGDIAGGERSFGKAMARVADLTRELNISQTWPNWSNDQELRRAAGEFIVDVVLGAAWYTATIRRARWYLWGYVALLIVLIVGVPSALAWLGHFGGAPAMPGVLTGALTGLFAIQKSLAAWAAKQQRYGTWYKASSDLKTIWYRLQTDWHGRVTRDRSDEFRAYLNAGTDKARGIIQAEQQAYFDSLTWPDVDALDAVTKTRGGVADFVASFIRAKPASPAGLAAATGVPAGGGATPKAAEPPTGVPSANVVHSIDTGLAVIIMEMNASLSEMRGAMSLLPDASASQLHGLLESAERLVERAESSFIPMMPAAGGRRDPPSIGTAPAGSDRAALADTIVTASIQLKTLHDTIVA